MARESESSGLERRGERAFEELCDEGVSSTSSSSPHGERNNEALGTKLRRMLQERSHQQGATLRQPGQYFSGFVRIS